MAAKKNKVLRYPDCPDCNRLMKIASHCAGWPTVRWCEDCGILTIEYTKGGELVREVFHPTKLQKV